MRCNIVESSNSDEQQKKDISFTFSMDFQARAKDISLGRPLSIAVLTKLEIITSTLSIF